MSVTSRSAARALIAGMVISLTILAGPRAGPADAAACPAATGTGPFTVTNTTVGECEWAVPANVASATFEVTGAKGGAGASGAAGGLGGRVVATITVTAGSVYRIYVGAKGSDGAGVTGGTGGAGGNNDSNGGNGWGTTSTGAGTAGGGGGGASDVRTGGSALSDRIVVGGGGGGGGGIGAGAGSAHGGGTGGAGGGAAGADGGSATRGTAGGGQGGSASAAGAGGAADTLCAGSAGSSGSNAAGGTSGANRAGGAGGGGGGGRFGGGSGGNGAGTCAGDNSDGGGGGGGSGLGPTGATFTTGVDAGNGGNGKIVITYSVTQPSAAAPTEVSLPATSGGASVVTTLPVHLPPSGIVQVDVTLIGPGGCKLFIPKGTLVTTSSGAPFSGKIFPPSTGTSGQPIDNGCSFTSSGGATLVFSSATASSRDAYAQAVTDLLTITMALPADATDPNGVRITKVDAATGAVSTIKGITSSASISFTTSSLGVYGVATVIDLARAAGAPSVTSDIPVRFPSRAIGPSVTLTGTGGSLTIPAGTTATVKDLNAAFAGTLAPPSATTASGVSSAASLVANVPQGLRFDKAATLTLPRPAGQENAAFVPVFVGTGGALTCLSGSLSGSGVATEITSTSTYALLASAKPALGSVDEASSSARTTVRPGHHSAWAGQSTATTLCPTQQVEVTVRLRNTGDLPWVKGTPRQVVLGSNAEPGNTRDFDRGILIAPIYNRDRFATHAEDTVRPGDIGTFTFTLRAPSTAGTYAVHVRPVIEGLQWLEDEGIHFDVVVR